MPATISGIQNSQWTPRCSTIGPARTSAKPAPKASTAAMTPTAPATLARGNSSRMIPNDNGITAPPTPWMTRATIRTMIEWDRPARTDPAASAARVATSNRSFPAMSPMRPRIGVKTDADSRYAVSTHVTVFWEVWYSCWMVGSAGTTRVWRMVYAIAPITRTAKVN